MNDFNYDNEIIEISSDDEKITSPIEELLVEPKKEQHSNNKKKIPNNLKIGIIIASIIVFLLLVGIIVYFIFFAKNDGSKEPVEEPVILEKDNYRYENGKLVFLDKSDRDIGTYECVDKDTEKCYVAKIDYTGDSFERVKSVNESGNEIIKTSQIYLNNYVFVYDSEKIILYNISTKESDLELKTIKAYNTVKNLVVVEDTDSKFGLLEITEEGYEYLIRPSYDNLGIVNDKLVYLIAQDKDKNYIIDSTGKKLSKDIKADVMSVNEEFIVAVKNDMYNLYSYEFDELLGDYNYISLHDGVIALVLNNRLYLNNNNLDKLYEDGIRLENNNYVKKYVYDKNNKLMETKKSYEIEVENNIATITIGEDSREINLLEGKISAKLEYLSYFDGKLYFYGDEEKIDVLGTYACKNKNIIDSEEDLLENCSLYSNEEGISGIYNNEFVFIYDSQNDNEKTYYLYSLKEKKNKGTYSSIEILNSSELNVNIKPIYTSSSFVIANSATGSNKGNYGVLQISSEKVSGKIGFKYKSIEKFDKYYLLINVDSSYSIYNESFNKLSNEFSYIKLFEKYYVGIINNKLNIYKYDSTIGILEKDLNVSSNEFTVDFKNGFVININDETYKYDLSGKEIIETPVVPDTPDVSLDDEENHNIPNTESSTSTGEENEE